MSGVRLVFVAGIAALAGACTLPCEQDADCPGDMFCGEGAVCAQECGEGAPCGQGEFCDRGRCQLDLRPQVTWVSPAPDEDVGEVFDVEVDVRFRAEEVSVELRRDANVPGEACAPLVPQRQGVPGDANRAVTQRVVFRGVRSLGERFGLEVAAANANHAFVVRRAFRGALEEELGGAEIIRPVGRWLDADGALSVSLDARFSPPAGLVSAWSAPLGGPPSTRRVLAEDVDEVAGLSVPLARGPQILWLETERTGERRRCGIGVDTPPTAVAGEVELGLWFNGSEPTDLDLWVYAEPIAGPSTRCSTRAPAGACGAVWSDEGLVRVGEEGLWLDEGDGVYGIAVAPGAATKPASALVRVSNRNVHDGWLGPRSLQADQGEVWLAARLWRVDGVVSVESIDQVRQGLPAEDASAW